KTTPANGTLLEGLAQFCADSFSTQNIVLVNSGVLKDQPNIRLFKQLYNEKVSARNIKDTLMETRGVNGSKTTYRSEKTNYYVILSENEVFISDFVTHLNMFADKKENIRLIGLRKWISIDN